MGERERKHPAKPIDTKTIQTTAGIPLDEVYDEESLSGRAPPFDGARDLGKPGEFPFTRGIHASMYRGKLWTMRQYAGFGTAAESNRRYKYLLASGQTGLSVAFDLPTQMGRDADHPLARGEVGRAGVSISSIDDMHALLDGLPLDTVSTSMTINATAATLLCLYIAVADERGIARDKLSGTVQNDILKEYIARGTYIYPPAGSMRLCADTFAWCAHELPRWNTVSVSGYHIREAGSDAVQEVAFTLADGIAYVEAARDAGLAVDAFAPRLSFFFNAHAHLLEEIAKFRAARRLWARIMRDRFDARDPRSQMLRFHAQTAGSTLTAADPLNNIARTTIEALAAVLGGAQSIHTNGYDEALALPTEASARVALRTQQILAFESGAGEVVDPLGGAYAIEALTSEIEARAEALIAEIDRRGGMVAAIEAGFPQGEIERRALAHQRAVESGARVIVGVNRFTDGESVPPSALHRPGAATEAAQAAALARLRNTRNTTEVEQALRHLRGSAWAPKNLFPPLLVAVKARATLGEIADVFRDIFGEYRPA
jgi:methylmalonyl-CoA mutase, N-terminal domain